MASTVQKVVLIGGTNDGLQVEVWSHQPYVYWRKRMTMKETERLRIDENVSWKTPEEVYERQRDGRFIYLKTVHYKPEDAEKNLE